MRYWMVLFVVGNLAACSKKTWLSRIETYLNASTPELKAKYMAADYHSFFNEKKGEGEDKASALKSFQQWDAPLHPDIVIIHYAIHKDSWVISLIEKNDFTKLIDFPGWKATEIITLNAEGFIHEAIYIPDSTNPDYRKWLQPALAWLQENLPADLQEVYQNHKLIQTEAAANKWKELLQIWRQQNKP
jgi:hypothetical protein